MIPLHDEMIVQTDGSITLVPSHEGRRWAYEEVMAWIGGGAMETWRIPQKGWVSVSRDAAWMEGHKVNDYASEIGEARFLGPVVFLRRKSCAWLRGK